ncbi:putative MFS family arabinose efflux permease [Catenulispora sp. GP43]|uniref:MFS transporter n=1 Tax=Catenulispora sp. GP43 TaxID=3156263 RepID=UPI003517362F
MESVTAAAVSDAADSAAAVTAVPSPPHRRTTYRDVFGQPQFRLLFSTRILGISAETLRITTLSVLIFTASHSPLLSALAFGIGFLPQLPGSMLFGALADRLRPRPLLTVGFLLQCAAAAVLGTVPMPTAAALGLVGAVAVLAPVFGGATSRLAAEFLTGDAYVLGRSLLNMASSGAQLVGLAVGGAAVAALGTSQALLLAAALNAGCATAVWLRLPDRPAPGSLPGGALDGAQGRPRGAVMAASWSGARRLLRDRAVRRLYLAQWLPSGFMAGAEGLIVSYAGQRGFAAGTYGLLMACGPTGMLVGDLVVGRMLRPAARERLVVPLAVWLGLPLLGLAADPSASVCALLLLASSTGFSYAIGLQRRFLEVLPADNQGQAFGLLSSGMMTLQGIGPVLVGAVAGLAGTGPAMAVAGGAAMLTGGWMASWLL